MMSALRNVMSPSRQGADGEDVPVTSESDRIISSDPEHAQANDPVADQEAVDDHPSSGGVTDLKSSAEHASTTYA